MRKEVIFWLAAAGFLGLRYVQWKSDGNKWSEKAGRSKTFLEWLVS